LNRLFPAIRRTISLLRQFDDAIAVVIVLALVVTVTYTLGAMSNASSDPNVVCLAYFKTLDNGTIVRCFDANATLDRMYIHNNPGACNVSYRAVIDFVLRDQTDRLIYNDSCFVCIDFAVAVHDNAERQNVTAGVVTCEIGDTLHALNIFNTTDKGLVYIDCTGGRAGEPVHDYDKIASIDRRYKVEPIEDISPYCYVSDRNDMVTNIHVYW
jgi:hypothetical protein